MNYYCEVNYYTKMKRAYGGGRKALAGQSQSRKAVYKCLASDYTGISDNVI